MIAQVSVTFLDDFNKQYHQRWTTKDLADFPTIQTAVSGLLTDLGNIVAARILRYSINIITAYTDTADAGANRDEGLVIVLEKENTYRDVLRLRAPITSIFDENGQVPVTDTALTALVSNFLTGGDFRFSDGEAAAGVVKAYLEEHG